MHLEIVVNQNSDSIRIDQKDSRNNVVKRGESLRCPNPTAVIRILHEVFNNLADSSEFIVDHTVEIIEINEDSIKQVGEW